MKTLAKTIIGLSAAGAGALAAYALAIRPWHIHWGATEEDIKRPMPLDEEIEHPDYVTNRAITINASSEVIWKWLVQMGESPRGGFYSYEAVERILGMDVSNADKILPEYQQLEVGNRLDRKGDMVVKAIETNKTLVLGPPKEIAMACTWAFCLYPLDANHTRVVSRVRARLPRTPTGLGWFLLLDPGQFIMERKMLLTLKQRAEESVKAKRELATQL